MKLYIISFSPKSALGTSLHTFHTQLQLQCNDVDEKFALKYRFVLPTSFVHFPRRNSSEKRCSTRLLIRQSLTQDERKRQRQKKGNEGEGKSAEIMLIITTKQLEVLPRNVCVLFPECFNSTISSSHTIWFYSLSEMWFCNIIKWNAIMVSDHWSPGSTANCES